MSVVIFDIRTNIQGKFFENPDIRQTLVTVVEKASSYTNLLVIDGLLNPWGIRVACNVFSLCESLLNMKNEIRVKDFVAIFQFF